MIRPGGQTLGGPSLHVNNFGGHAQRPKTNFRGVKFAFEEEGGQAPWGGTLFAQFADEQTIEKRLLLCGAEINVKNN